MSAVADRLRDVVGKLSDLEQWVRNGYAYIYVEVENDSYPVDLGQFGEQEISITAVNEEYEVDPENILSSAGGEIQGSSDLDRLVDELNEAIDEIEAAEAIDEIPTAERIKELAEALAGTLTGAQKAIAELIIASTVALISAAVPDALLVELNPYANGEYDDVIARFDYDNVTYISGPSNLDDYRGERSLIVGDDVDGVGLVTAVVDKPDGTRVITYGGVSITSGDSNKPTPYDKVLDPGDNGNQWYWNRPTPIGSAASSDDPYRPGTRDEVLARFDYEGAEAMGAFESELLVGDNAAGIGLVIAMERNPDGSIGVMYGQDKDGTGSSGPRENRLLKAGEEGRRWVITRPTPIAAQAQPDPVVTPVVPVKELVRADEVRIGDTLFVNSDSIGSVVTGIDGGDGSIDAGPTPVRLLTEDQGRYTRRPTFEWNVIRAPLDSFKVPVETATALRKLRDIPVGSLIGSVGDTQERVLQSQPGAGEWRLTVIYEDGTNRDVRTYDFSPDTTFTTRRPLSAITDEVVNDDSDNTYDPLTVEVGPSVDVRAGDLKIGDNFSGADSLCRITELTNDGYTVTFTVTYSGGSTANYTKDVTYVFGNVQQAVIPEGATPRIATTV